MIGPEEPEQSAVDAGAARGHVEKALLDARRPDDCGRRKCPRQRRLVADVQLQASAVIARRFAADGEADRIVGLNLALDASAMRWRPGVAEQKDQLAIVLDRIAKIDRIEAEVRHRARRRRPAGFPIDIAGKLADFLAG